MGTAQVDVFMILFLYGTDTYRSRQQLKKIVEKFKADRDPRGYNVVRLDASVRADAELVLEEIMAPPFLAERRMVVVASLLFAGEKEIQSELLVCIEEGRVPASTVLVLWEAADAFKKKEAQALFTRLSKEKYAQEFQPFSGPKRTAWVEGELTFRNARMTPEALRYFLLHASQDSWELESLLDQLSAYRSGLEIRTEDIRLFMGERDDENIFSLVDAIIQGRMRDAGAMVREQYRLGKDPIYVLSMVSRQVRILLALRDYLDRGDTMSSNDAAGMLGLHPFVVKKTLPFVRQHSFAELKCLHRELLHSDRAIKTGEGDPRVLLDAFIARQAKTLAIQ